MPNKLSKQEIKIPQNLRMGQIYTIKYTLDKQLRTKPQEKKTRKK